ncbi:MAG: DUF1343 domain-containing protein, partial [Pseudomonadota bacterium]
MTNHTFSPFLRITLRPLMLVLTLATMIAMPFVSASARVTTGAEQLILSAFNALNGKRVGLITNQTGRVGKSHLVDILADAPNLKLVRIFAPEHGFRGLVEAGKKVSDKRDPKTGVEVASLYGKTKKPTRRMLRGLDVLVFDIQDVGVRYYTYISTMGLAMQAAAEAGLPFVVLDRANPLGGTYVSGDVLEMRHSSFVGQYPIPIVHGMTVGELARMIKGEGWLPGLGRLDLTVVKMRGWSRDMLWPNVSDAWIATSPNIPTFESALVYPGIGIVGLTDVNEGRGTPIPFSQFGAPWLDAREAARRLSRAGLPGVKFRAVRYVPKSIPGVAVDPLFRGRQVNAVRLRITDAAAYRPLETGIHALVETWRQHRRSGRKQFIRQSRMFTLISGTRRLRRALEAGRTRRYSCRGHGPPPGSRHRRCRRAQC